MPKPLTVTCGNCQHVWTAAFAPMPMAAMATVLKDLHCPMCGIDSSQIFKAPAGAMERERIEGMKP